MSSSKKLFGLLMTIAVILGFLTACRPQPDTDVLYVNLTWHQHQPFYFKDADGVYSRPWVRVHATKSYLDMAQKVADYDDIRVTFNLTPSLIRQLDDFASGAKDIYWVLSEKPASTLSIDEKRFILERFFDINWENVVSKYPRYQELLDKRGGWDEASIQAAIEGFTDQDFLDLQVWFNLAWFDPVFLEQDPLVDLVQKGRGFREEDKAIIFDETLKIIQEVVPFHKSLQDAGQIEVTTTPYAHPILPLIYDNQLALVGNPSAEMPERRFAYPQDAKQHLAFSVEMYEDIFGREVRGLWPAEGGVAQDIVHLVADAGFTYMQTGEPVLAKSLGIESFTRNSEGFVQDPDALYRPYYVRDEDGNQVAVFFRDWTLSDNIGFVYSGMQGEAGARDLVSRLERIHADLIENQIEGPHIVSIILDGENAWEHYPNDGNDFLNGLYRFLSESTVLKTVTPSAYLEMFPEQRTLENLFPGAWFSPNFDTWIGETEEAIAWDYLARTRDFLKAYEEGEKEASPEALAQAFDYMYLAEGSDWFWWFGDDQDSGQDSYFDEAFRALLAGVYQSLGEAVPRFVQVPVIQASAVPATRPFRGVSTPEIDGQADTAWDTAAFYAVDVATPVSGFYVTLDNDNLYLRLDLDGSIIDHRAGFYFNVTDSELSTTPFAHDSERILGFGANKFVEWRGGETLELYQTEEESWVMINRDAGQVVMGEDLVEISIPLNLLGDFSAGDEIKLALMIEPDGLLYPFGGPANLVMPDLGEINIILRVTDPIGDDYGPGTYIYPKDMVFKDSVFDVRTFEVGYDAENLVLTFEFVGPVENPWGSPNGLSVQTLDVYIDKDPGMGTGARLLLPGRNAALPEDYGWEYAIWAEGWNPQVMQVDSETLAPIVYSEASSSMRIVVDAARNAVIVRVPRHFFGEGNPEEWAYAAVVLGQEGFPSQGVWRVRDVEPEPAQYRFGGGPEDINHTRIIDLVYPEDGDLEQASILSDYPSLQGSIDALGPDDFVQIPMLYPNQQ